MREREKCERRERERGRNVKGERDRSRERKILERRGIQALSTILRFPKRVRD